MGTQMPQDSETLHKAYLEPFLAGLTGSDMPVEVVMALLIVFDNLLSSMNESR